MPTVLFTAPYMIPFVDRFKRVFDQYGIDLIIPDVRERMEKDVQTKTARISRRDFLKAFFTGGLAVTGLAAGEGLARQQSVQASQTDQQGHAEHGSDYGMSHMHGASGTVGQVDHQANGFDPSTLLYEWDYGQVSQLPSGQRLREFHIGVVDKDIEIAPGVFVPAWAYNGRVPGPSLRCIEGDRVRVKLVNAGSHPHTIHFHGIHSARMDGVPGVGAGEIPPGGETVYEFDAYPFGCHLYHFHVQSPQAPYSQGALRRVCHRPRPGKVYRRGT